MSGGHAAALRQALHRGKTPVSGFGQARQGDTGQNLVARQRLSSAQSARVASDPAFQSGLVAIPRSGEMARLGSAAVLQLARVSGFWWRATHRSIHALD